MFQGLFRPMSWNHKPKEKVLWATAAVNTGISCFFFKGDFVFIFLEILLFDGTLCINRKHNIKSCENQMILQSYICTF